MNLKLVVTTMIVAGAVSANAFADQNVQAEMDAMQAQLAQLQASVSANSAGNNLTSANWFNRISLSGLLNVDAMGSTGYSPTDYVSRNPSTISVSTAALYADADVSDWTKAHIGLVYGADNQTQFNLLQSGAHSSSSFNGNGSNVHVDEAYATIANLAKSPFYLKAGQQYLPFGSYTPFADMTPSVTQVMSQVNDPAAVVGFVTNNGFNGSAYVLQGEAYNQDNGENKRTAIQNYGASLGLNNTYNNVSYNGGLGFLSNLNDLDAMRYFNTSYEARTPGLAANLGVKYSAFDLSGKWVGATKQFNASDLTYDGNGAKPKAWNVDAGYSFPVLAHNSRAGLGYQGSSQAVSLVDGGSYHMPKTRYLADYTVNVSKYTDLGFELRHDIDYTVANGGTGKSTNTAAARLAVKFA